MKIAVIGGGGVRTPLLVRGLVGSDLPIREIALYDPDAPRLATISALARRLARDTALITCETCGACNGAGSQVVIVVHGARSARFGQSAKGGK